MIHPCVPRRTLSRTFIAGLLMPCGFAPMHIPGMVILSIAIFYATLQKKTLKQAAYLGFIFGLGYWGLGVSWVYVSIHAYGHLNLVLSAILTLIFIGYLALFTATLAGLYVMSAHKNRMINACLFSALWCLSEYCRAHFLTGFPWLLLGYSQIETPLKYLLPLIGVFGVGFCTCLAATAVALISQRHTPYRLAWTTLCVMILLLPLTLQGKQWTTRDDTPLSVGIIQENLSMRDKWDEGLFWTLLDQYEEHIASLLGKSQLIVLPESAIPLPAHFINDYLETINAKATKAGSSIVFGIPETTDMDGTSYFNTMTSLGFADGSYAKQHLVPFGEFIPWPLKTVFEWLDLPNAAMQPGRTDQALMRVHDYAIASLICYELAYPNLLRNQLPKAAWIISISDSGWFGHSLAIYQQLQMAQTLSMQTGRYQVLASNDGLSSVIDTHGHLVASLPAFRAGILQAALYPATGETPWVSYGDKPVLLFCGLILIMTLLFPLAAERKRRYPCRTTQL